MNNMEAGDFGFALDQLKHGRRVKLFCLRPEFVLALVARPRSEYLSVLNFPELPQGCTLLGVEFEFARHAFVFMVEHDSFDPVPDGEIPPMLEGWRLDYKRILSADELTESWKCDTADQIHRERRYAMYYLPGEYAHPSCQLSLRPGCILVSRESDPENHRVKLVLGSLDYPPLGPNEPIPLLEDHVTADELCGEQSP